MPNVKGTKAEDVLTKLYIAESLEPCLTFVPACSGSHKSDQHDMLCKVDVGGVK